MSELQKLSIDDLSLVFSDLDPLSAKWNKIGLYLNISKRILEKIDEDYKKTDRKMEELISFWLRNEVDEVRNYKTIAMALAQAGEKVEAQRIADREHFSLEIHFPFNELFINYLVFSSLLFVLSTCIFYYFGVEGHKYGRRNPNPKM